MKGRSGGWTDVSVCAGSDRWPVALMFVCVCIQAMKCPLNYKVITGLLYKLMTTSLHYCMSFHDHELTKCSVVNSLGYCSDEDKLRKCPCITLSK